MTDHGRFVALMLLVAFCFLVAFCTACGPSFKQIQHQYDNAADACVAQAHELERSCPNGDECVARLHDLRTRCDAELARICHQSRRAERVCP